MKKCVISLLNGYGHWSFIAKSVPKLRVISHSRKLLGEKMFYDVKILSSPGCKHGGLHPSYQDTLFHIKSIISYCPKLLHQHFLSSMQVYTRLCWLVSKTSALQRIPNHFSVCIHWQIIHFVVNIGVIIYIRYYLR